MKIYEFFFYSSGYTNFPVIVVGMPNGVMLHPLLDLNDELFVLTYFGYDLDHIKKCLEEGKHYYENENNDTNNDENKNENDQNENDQNENNQNELNENDQDIIIDI